MATITQLRRQLSRMKTESRAREQMIKKNAEKRMLQKQLFVLKHPRLVKSASTGLALGKTGLSSIVSAAKRYHRYQQAKKGRR